MILGYIRIYSLKKQQSWVTMGNYKIMPALIMFLQVYRKIEVERVNYDWCVLNFDYLKVWTRSSIFIAPSKVASRFPFLSYMAR